MKNQLRLDFINKRKNLSNIEIASKSNKIIINLKNLDLIKKAKNIFIYASNKYEVQTLNFIKDNLIKKNIFLPFKDELENVYQVQNINELIFDSRGILQPIKNQPLSLSNIDIFVIPGVVFDKKFNRIGHGSGFFDKLLKIINKPKVALAYKFQIINEIPNEKHDIEMNYIVNEEGVLKNDN